MYTCRPTCRHMPLNGMSPCVHHGRCGRLVAGYHSAVASRQSPHWLYPAATYLYYSTTSYTTTTLRSRAWVTAQLGSLCNTPVNLHQSSEISFLFSVNCWLLYCLWRCYLVLELITEWSIHFSCHHVGGTRGPRPDSVTFFYSNHDMDGWWVQVMTYVWSVSPLPWPLLPLLPPTPVL